MKLECSHRIRPGVQIRVATVPKPSQETLGNRHDVTGPWVRLKEKDMSIAQSLLGKCPVRLLSHP